MIDVVFARILLAMIFVAFVVSVASYVVTVRRANYILTRGDRVTLWLACLRVGGVVFLAEIAMFIIVCLAIVAFGGAL